MFSYQTGSEVDVKSDVVSLYQWVNTVVVRHCLRILECKTCKCKEVVSCEADIQTVDTHTVEELITSECVAELSALESDVRSITEPECRW